MQPLDFIIDTLSHFVKAKEGPSPGIPARTDPDFERELTWLCEWHAVTPVVLASLERLALRPRISRITLARIGALADASSSLTGDLLTTAVSLAGQFEEGASSASFSEARGWPAECTRKRGSDRSRESMRLCGRRIGRRLSNDVKKRDFAWDPDIRFVAGERKRSSTINILRRASWRTTRVSVCVFECGCLISASPTRPNRPGNGDGSRCVRVFVTSERKTS